MQQLLFPDITFTCNGSITKWIVGGTTKSAQKQAELQIWRNTGGTSYSKINSSPLSHSTLIGNVAEYSLSTPLEFQEGDILGLHQPNTQNSELVVYFQEFDGPGNIYEEGPNPSSTITLSSSPDSYNYPLVTVEISIGKIIL